MVCKCLERAAKVCDRAASIAVPNKRYENELTQGVSREIAKAIRALPCDCVCVERELLEEFRTFINMTGDGANAGHIALAKRIDALLATKEPT